MVDVGFNCSSGDCGSPEATRRLALPRGRERQDCPACAEGCS